MQQGGIPKSKNSTHVNALASTIVYYQMRFQTRRASVASAPECSHKSGLDLAHLDHPGARSPRCWFAPLGSPSNVNFYSRVGGVKSRSRPNSRPRRHGWVKSHHNFTRSHFSRRSRLPLIRRSVPNRKHHGGWLTGRKEGSFNYPLNQTLNLPLTRGPRASVDLTLCLYRNSTC